MGVEIKKEGVKLIANYDTLERAKIAVTSADKSATFAMGIQSCYLVTDADCFIDFDTAAVASQSLLLKANFPPALIEFHGGNVGQIHAITSGGTANLYILGVRGQ